MGHWDYQAIEILENETPVDVMRALYETQRAVDGHIINHLFRAYHTFCHNDKRYLHIGWNSCNARHTTSSPPCNPREPSSPPTLALASPITRTPSRHTNSS